MSSLRNKLAVWDARATQDPQKKIDQDLQDPSYVDHVEHEPPLPKWNDLDPDGLNSKIRGKYADLLKQDPLFLQARSWQVHPGTLTNAVERMGADWVRQQIQYVSMRQDVRFKNKFLSKILRYNPF